MLLWTTSAVIQHPDPVVETSSLSSVEPQDVWYKLAIPDTTIECGELSALQLEAITYASQRVFNATFNDISVISWRSVLLVEETKVPREKKTLTCRKSLTNFIT
jgi:hypothetical protein